MIELLKKIGGRTFDRTNDVEGMCQECKGSLDLIFVVKTRDRIDVHVKPCPDHPNGAMILWPCDRDDITAWWVDEGGIHYESHR